jgi:nitroreductase
MDAIQAMHGRRSIRAYEVTDVARAVVEDLVWAAVQAPTPPVSGDAPWIVCVLRGADRLEALGERAKEYARTHQPSGRPWTWPERPGFRVLWGAPALVLFCARRDNPETKFDCCRAGQNFEVAAHSVGLGSCWVGSPLPWLRSPGVNRELGIPDEYEAEVAIVFGHPAERPVGNPRPRPCIRWLETQ